MVDYASLKRLLRTNEEDDKADGIAPRYDLSRKSKFEFGMIDQKIGWQESMRLNFVDGVSSPPFDSKMPAFDWRNWPNSPHEGMPDVWNFDWVELPISLE